MPKLDSINACCDYLEARIKEMKVEESVTRPPIDALISHFDVGLGWVDSAQAALVDDVLQLNDEMDADNGDNQHLDDEYLPRDDGSESECDDEEFDGSFDDLHVSDYLQKLHPKIVSVIPKG
jgi:hypothetical protein